MSNVKGEPPERFCSCDSLSFPDLLTKVPVRPRVPHVCLRLADMGFHSLRLRIFAEACSAHTGPLHGTGGYRDRNPLLLTPGPSHRHQQQLRKDRSAAIQNYVPGSAGAPGKKALVPLVPAGQQQGAQQSQTRRPPEPLPKGWPAVEQGRPPGVEKAQADRPVSDEMPAFSDVMVDHRPARRGHRPEQPGPDRQQPPACIICGHHGRRFRHDQRNPRQGGKPVKEQLFTRNRQALSGVKPGFSSEYMHPASPDCSPKPGFPVHPNVIKQTLFPRIGPA